MNSINQQQPENNHRDLQADESIKKIKELVTASKTCFLATVKSTPNANSARPMSVRKVDDNGHLWFLSASDSHQNLDIQSNPTVTLYFQGGPHSEFLLLHGAATISRDRKKIEELWEPIIKTWFTGGIDDPRITVLQVIPSEGYYWDTKHGDFIAGIKMMIGAISGKTLDDSIEGRLQLNR
jgi:general stress protein 26